MCRALALHLVHPGDELSGSARKAHSPAGHAVGFAHAVERQSSVVEFRFHLCRRRELELVIDHMFIDVVGEYRHVRLTQQNIGKGAQLSPGVGRPRRIAWRVEHKPACARCDRRFEFLRAQTKASFGRTGHDNGHPFGKHGDVRVGEPVGGRDDHLVAGIDACHERVVNHLLAATADGDLVQFVIQRIVATELLDDGFAQLHGAVHGGVIGLARFNCANRRLFDVIGRVEIGLTKCQRNDVAARGRQICGTLGYGQA